MQDLVIRYHYLVQLKKMVTWGPHYSGLHVTDARKGILCSFGCLTLFADTGCVLNNIKPLVCPVDFMR